MTDEVQKLMAAAIPCELTVEEQPDRPAFCPGYWGVIGYYQVCWSDGSIELVNIPETWIDLVPYMLARKLLEQGYNPSRLLIVRLRGADYKLMQAPLGVVAATPLPNSANPVTKSTRCVYDTRRF